MATHSPANMPGEVLHEIFQHLVTPTNSPSQVEVNVELDLRDFQTFCNTHPRLYEIGYSWLFGREFVFTTMMPSNIQSYLPLQIRWRIRRARLVAMQETAFPPFWSPNFSQFFNLRSLALDISGLDDNERAWTVVNTQTLIASTACSVGTVTSIEMSQALTGHIAPAFAANANLNHGVWRNMMIRALPAWKSRIFRKHPLETGFETH